MVYLTDGLGRATLAFDILLGLIHFAILVRRTPRHNGCTLSLTHSVPQILQCADDPIAQVDKNYGEGYGRRRLQRHSLYARSIDSFLGCLVTQLEATGINNIVQILLIFLIPVRPSPRPARTQTHASLSALAHRVACLSLTHSPHGPHREGLTFVGYGVCVLHSLLH